MSQHEGSPASDAERTETAEVPYEMSLSLNVLNHLGLNLYSNVPAVLSEAVANAWDADAETVDVDIDSEGGRIVITDDGHGMDGTDVNNRYLNVGYRRRQDDARPNRTAKHDRPVMGRKGIGKLSLLSIAETVEIYTTKDGTDHALRLDVDEIERAIDRDEATGGQQRYRPTVLDTFPDDLERGTRIVLTDLTKRVHTTETALRKRIARRFSVLGSEYDFTVRINGDPVGVTDRDYFHKVQFLWTFADERYVEHCRDAKLELHEAREGVTEGGFEVRGWIGTAEKPSDLVEDYPGEAARADDLNKVSLMVRGRMAKQDLLQDFNDGRMYTKYLVGEIHADFLDYDDEDDIATSSREDVVREDPRYQELVRFLKDELNHIASRWNDLRNEQGSDEARRIDAIDMWFESLSPDNRERAKKLFGKINQITVDDESERNELFKHGVLAFENLKYKENLETLSGLGTADDRTISRALTDLDDIESSQYHQIVTHRHKLVREFRRRIEVDGLTTDVYDHLRDHPWLLDPSWERAPISARVRDEVRDVLDEVPGSADLGESERDAEMRCVRTVQGYALVSLRHPADTADAEFIELADVFRVALQRVLEDDSKTGDTAHVVFVVPDTAPWRERKGLMQKNGIVVREYTDLLAETEQSYRSYLSRDQGAGRVSRLIDEIEAGDQFD